MMTKAKEKTSGEVVPKAELQLQAKANLKFKEAKEQAAVAKSAIWKLGGILAGLRDSGLWKHVTDKDGVPRFKHWDHCAEDIVGPMARGKYYELIASYSLTQGENPIPAKEVQKMGIKRAAEVAKLEPEQRTPEIRRAATTEPVMAVKNKVQAKLNETLPADEQKPMLKLLSMNLPEDTLVEFERMMEVMVYMEGIRDGDNTHSMRAKAFQTMLWATQQYLAQELADALEYKKLKEGGDDSSEEMAQADGPEDEEDEEDGGYDGPDAEVEEVHAH